MQGIAHLNPRPVALHCGPAARSFSSNSNPFLSQHRRPAVAMAATSEATQALKAVFPESHLSLKEADPEAFAIIELEKERQWWVPRPRTTS